VGFGALATVDGRLYAHDDVQPNDVQLNGADSGRELWTESRAVAIDASGARPTTARRIQAGPRMITNAATASRHVPIEAARQQPQTRLYCIDLNVRVLRAVEGSEAGGRA
jgi:hypothetical protein